MPYDIFISYASQDLAAAEVLYQRLDAEHFKIWFDKARLEPGFDWHNQIEQGCENSRVVLPILTPRWKASDWTRFETYGAEVVIPLIFEGEWQDIVTPPLERFQAEKFDCTSLDDAIWEKLFTAIRRRLGEPPLEKTIRVANLRYRANDYFTGREKELVRIHEEFHCNPRAVLTQGRVRALAAMGGAGKTTLARHYAEKFWRCYPQMFWVDCRIGMEAEFAHLHDLIFPDRIDIGLNEADKAASALNELSGPVARLLVLDNAEDEMSTMKWIPKTGGCHTLITSRFAGWSATIRAIHIFVLESAPSVEFLQKRVCRNVADLELDACHALAKKLGYLPLALEQAAAYIEQQGEGFGFTDYIQLYDEATSELLNAGTLGTTEYPDAVITTWKSTIAMLTPGSRAILHLCSYLASIPIPVEMLIDGADIVREYTSRFTGGVPLPAVSNNTIWVRSELARLKAYSMAQSDGQSLTLHPLVQVVELLADTNEQRLHGWNHAVSLLQKSAPPASWEGECRILWSLANEKRWSQILLHVIRLEQLIKTHDACVPSRLFMYLSVNAHASQSQGKDAHALDECQLLMNLIKNDNDCREVPFNDVLKSLAYLKKENGLHQEALHDFTALYQARAKEFGEESAATLRTRHVIGCVLQLLGRTEEAEALMKEVLSIQERVLGEDHYDTIISLHNLGWLLAASENRWHEAEPLYRHALERWKHTVGFEIFDTRIAARNLVILLERKSDFTEAERIQMELMQGTEAALGQDHKDTVEAINALGIMYANNGSPAKAEPLLRRVRENRVRSAGSEHPDTLLATRNLATVMEMIGNHDGTMNLHHRTLEASEHELGGEHPEFLRELNNHAHELRKAGLVAEAEPFDRRAATTTVKVLGETHPLALHRRNNLALTLILLSKLDEARAILAQNAQAKVPLFENLIPRITLLQWVVELLEDRALEAVVFLGRLRTHVAGELLPICDGIAVPWDIAYFIDVLQPKLEPHNTDLLRALVAVFNARTTPAAAGSPPSDLRSLLTTLGGFSAWREAEYLPIE